MRAKREKTKGVDTFTRRELHGACGWSFTQLRIHLERLIEQEYVAAHCGRMGSQFVYELLIDIDAPEHATHVPMLDVETLKTHAYKVNLAGLTAHLAGGDGVAPRGVKCA